MLQQRQKRGENLPAFAFSDLLVVGILPKAVGSLAVHNQVDSGNLILALDPESNRLFDCESNCQRYNETLEQDTEGCDGLNYQLTKVTTGEQPSVSGKEAKEQGAE